MDISQVSTVVAIVVITYLIGVGAKLVPKVRDDYFRVVFGIVGGILGVVGMYIIPDYPAQDVLNAIAVGIMSGLASTGVNQIYKQAKKGSDTNA